jgi:hypothetical protein
MGADAIGRLYVVLEQMVRCAQEGKRAEVSRLNKEYESLNPRKLYRRMDEEVAGDYDNCRQSCALIGMLFTDAEAAVQDAQKRFARIPKPALIQR